MLLSRCERQLLPFITALPSFRASRTKKELAPAKALPALRSINTATASHRRELLTCAAFHM